MIKTLLIGCSVLLLCACGGGGGGTEGNSDNNAVTPTYTAFTSTHMDADNSDIQPIIDRLKDYDVVSLGEPSHSGSVVHFLKSRLLKGMHQQGQLDMIVFEAGFYDGLAAWENYLTGKQPLIEAITGPDANYMYMHRHSLGVSQIVNYVNDVDQVNDPLILVGFDTRINSDPACVVKPELGTSVMLNELETYLVNAAISTEDMAAIHQVAPVMMCPWYTDVVYQGDYDLHWKLLLALFELEAKLTAQVPNETIPAYDPTQPRNFRDYASFWLQIVKGMQAHAKMQYEDYYPVADISSADNVRWLREVWFGATQQTALWAHNIHISKHADTVPTAMKRNQPSLSMYSILVLDNGGTYAPYTPDHTQWKIDTESFTYPDFSLNAKLADMQLPNAFFDFDAENRSNQLFSGGNFIYGVPQGGLVAPHEVMDGMIFIPVEEATKSRYE
ncbi:hypothetical protein [Motilimonas eburnea]|uniref:hypothetical protein n=1 Tax=Motilimonas eburnea TaxID=1737488 RepID=UPI001E5B32F6|nr:hypothetical protein [Motilimonas eburnea]MCE2572017.1 hypothetical protein [Motilimonas eburnea]